MNKDALLSGMVFLILALSSLPNPVSADAALYTFCSPKSPSYTPNSPFEKNLKRLLQSLSSNASLTKGFLTENIGDGSDAVYGRALCRGDVRSTDCQKCLQNASRAIVNECKQSEDAIIWYEFCQLQYSFQNLSSLMVYTGKYPTNWNNQWKNVTENVHFNLILMNMMKNLSDGAVSDASKVMFATGKAKFSRNGTVYGLVQCTRDITGSDCYNCLDSALGDLKRCCSSRQGGMVLSRTCNVRFQLDRFYRNTARGDKKKIRLVVAVAVACMLTFAVAVLVVSYVVYICPKKDTQKDERSQKALLPGLQGASRVAIEQESDIVDCQELPIMDLATIRTATDYFLDSNKLGQGGFGTVYKGVLPNGKEIAIKRLSRKSRQGLKEFKNEIILISKLQHRNLVRLLGCGIEGEENLLIYEFMPNKSLDIIIFDSERRAQLHWETCYNIIVGIARGLLYLHDDSRLRVIHRDLKPSNVLLDHEMVAKISDFGMARIFCENQNTANTRRVVGTYGYMAPEYAMGGLFSVKSDVFSFGVIILEIISGKKNSGFYLTEHSQSLLTYVWRLWNEGKEMELVEPMLTESCRTTEVLRCIQIGLLCVQEDPADRPTMSAVVVLLGNESIALPEPKLPAFAVSRVAQNDRCPTSNPSINQMTCSSISPR